MKMGKKTWLEQERLRAEQGDRDGVRGGGQGSASHGPHIVPLHGAGLQLLQGCSHVSQRHHRWVQRGQECQASTGAMRVGVQ